MSDKNDMELNRYHEDIELIDRYIQGDLNSEEEKYVKSRLVMDAEFRELYDDMEVLIEGIQRSEEEEEEDPETYREIRMKPGEQQNEEAIPLIIIWWKRPVYRAMAAVFTLLVAATIILNPFASSSNIELFHASFEAFPNYDGPVRGEANDENLIRQAFQAYDAGNYTLAIQKFLQSGESKENSNQFYLANAYLANAEPDNAIKLLVEITERGEGLAIHAKWYLALSYLANDDAENAALYFKEIAQSDNEYSSRANKLMKELK